ncbi:MAG: hypothetical protein M3Q03_03005, partial [Chloroflexota bacterium]|nr:hypothetical protein [Chloroflexota bacterium]
EATVLVHVLDATHPNAAEQATTVGNVLEELGADDKPMVLALNKIDALRSDRDVDPSALAAEVGFDHPEDAAAISAQKRLGLDGLLAKIEATLEADANFVPVRLSVPFDRTDLVDRFHRLGRVEETSHDETGTTLLGQLPAAAVGRFAPFLQQLPRLAAERSEGADGAALAPEAQSRVAAAAPESAA